MPGKLKTFTIIFAIGSAILVAGFIPFLYCKSNIDGLQYKLTTSNPTQEEQWAILGAMQWWLSELNTVYLPISVVLIATGLLILIYSAVYLSTNGDKPARIKEDRIPVTNSENRTDVDVSYSSEKP
jgi:hypothetical protein